MRTDLTAAFQTAMATNGRAPVQLLVFHFSTGDVFISDRPLGPADGLANTYSALVENWGVLEDVAATDPGELSAEIRQMALTLWNGGTPPFSEHFLRGDPENTTVDLYQWFYGLGEADKALVDTFLIADPIAFDERARLVRLDLVSLAINFDQAAGSLLSSAAWPTAKTDDVGRPINFLFGNCGPVNTLCARTAPAASLAGSILANATVIATHENLDSLGFSAAGVLQIGEELVRYSSRSASAFYVAQRGYLSEAAEHLDRDEIIEKISDHTYIIGAGPLGSVEKVQVGGFDAPAGIYQVQANQAPARVVFSEKPYSFQFAAGSTFLEMQFDTITGANNAIQPYFAYDAASNATAAQISKNNRVLALEQTTINADRGAIVKAYLAVEHWESAAFLYDWTEVWVEGIGVVGRLSRPNINDTIEVAAEVDIDHGHSHVIGGEHTHGFVDPTIATNETAHSHVSSSGGVTETYEKTDFLTLYADFLEYDGGNIKMVSFSEAPKSFDGGTITFQYRAYGAKLKCRMAGSYFNYLVAPGEVKLGVPQRSSDYPFYITFEAYYGTTLPGYVTVSDIKFVVNRDLSIYEATTGVQSQIAQSGINNATASDKRQNDVNNLVTDNQDVQVTTSDSATRTHVNLFDITRHVNFDWNWFSGREVRVTYQGSNDNRTVYVLHCFFDVEYRKRQRVYSDDVTATITTGLVDDGAGTITGTPGAAITRADHVLKYFLTTRAGLDAGRIDAATWAAAAGRLAAMGYTVDGVIAADSTIKDVIKTILFQNRLRLYYTGGRAKLSFIETFADWPEGRAIAPDDYQLKSLAIERQPAANIINTVNLFYARDWTIDDDGPAGYEQTATTSQAESVGRHGARANDEKFLFSLVRSNSQAASLAAFYAERYAWPSNYIQFNAYLPQFDLEKEDKLNLTAVFHRLRKAKGRVIGAQRVFGSGKLGQINHIRFLIECLRYILIEQNAADSVAALDAINVSIGRLGDIEDLAILGDALTMVLNMPAPQEITVTDTLDMMAGYAPEIDEPVTAADAFSYGIEVVVDEPVRVSDDFIAWRTFGFGGGEFGGLGFGGWIIWHNRAPDEVQASITLSIDMVPGALPLSATVDDDLYFTCGFGCPLGSGFGLGPFGS